MSGKQLVNDDKAAELWGKAAELLEWGADHRDKGDPDDPLADHMVAAGMAEELAVSHELTARRYRAGGAVRTARAHERLAAQARQLGAYHLSMLEMERLLQQYFKRGCRRTAGVERRGA